MDLFGVQPKMFNPPPLESKLISGKRTSVQWCRVPSLLIVGSSHDFIEAEINVIQKENDLTSTHAWNPHSTQYLT